MRNRQQVVPWERAICEGEEVIWLGLCGEDTTREVAERYFAGCREEKRKATDELDAGLWARSECFWCAELTELLWIKEYGGK